MRLIFLALAAAMLQVAPLAAETKRLPKSQQEVQLSFAPLVRQVAPGVVNIYTRRMTQQQARSPLFDDPVFRRFFGDGPLQGAPRQRIQQSLGSGVIVDQRGLVVTNNHVIEGAEEITVALHDRREFDAELVLADPRTDLAVLRIDPKGSKLTELELMDSDDLEVGDLVLAIGNPFGVGQTVTSGIVSALGRTMVGTSDTQSFVQTDAAINPGNSGGALITMDGRVAGINTAIFSRTGGSHGIGFAIPANLVASVLHAAQAGHGVQRPWLGASGQSVTSELAQSLGLERPSGVLVNTVVRDSPASRAGLRPGDVVLAVNGKEVFDPRGLKFRIVTRNIGETVALDIFRKGTRRQVSLPLLAPPENPPRDQISLSGNQPLAGAEVANLSPALAEELGLDEGASGVIVLDVARGSPAQRFRVRPGDVILSVNGADVGRTRELQVMLKAEPGPRGWAIRLERRGQVITLAVR